jgi:hypothetical protein
MNQTLRTLRVVVLVTGLFAAPLLLAAFVGANPPLKVWLDAPGWSRARLVATTRLDEAVPMAVDERGGVYLFLVQAEGAARRARVVALDRGAAIAWERSFALPSAPSSPRLLLDGGDIVLLWVGDQRLYAARLDQAGNLAAEPAPVSGDARVVSLAAAGASGQVAAWFASAGETPGVYRVALEESPPRVTLVDQAGSRPALQYDGAGALHAVWLSRASEGETRVYHATYPGGAYRPDAQLQIGALEGFGPGERAVGPVLGLDEGHGYLLWTSYVTSGMNAGRSTSRYLAFPLGQPSSGVAAATLALPGTTRLGYEVLPGAALEAGERVAFTPSPSYGAVPSAFAANGSPATELAVACEVLLQSGGRNTGRVCALFFEGGAPGSYQLLSDGRRSAFTPTIASDGEGRLYLTWREIQGAESAVYFASTAPDIAEALSVLTPDDGLRILSDVIFGMIAGAILSPFTILLWVAPALLALAPFWLLGRASPRIGERMAGLSLAVALGVFWVGKLAILREAFGFVPLSGWVPALPAWLGLPLQIGVPLLIAALALLVAWDQSYRRGRPWPALFVLIYGAIDSVATMAVYGERLFG